MKDKGTGISDKQMAEIESGLYSLNRIRKVSIQHNTLMPVPGSSPTKEFPE